MPPITPPAAAPTPDWLPSTVTLRTDSTVASVMVDRRCASLRLTTSGLVVVQPASTATARIGRSFFMCGFLREVRPPLSSARLDPRGKEMFGAPRVGA
jgi:hypothetical protein